MSVSAEALSATATLLLLDVPLETEFGIDMNIWTVGPLFKGVKLIEPGIHFVFYAAGSGNSRAPRVGEFVCLAAGDVVVKRWDVETEMLVNVTGDEAERYAAGVKAMDFDRGLGAIPNDDEAHSKWLELSSLLSPRLLRVLKPTSGVLLASSAALSDSEAQAAGVATTETHTPSDIVADARLANTDDQVEAHYTVIDRGLPEGLTPAEISQWSMDKTQALEVILSSYKLPRDLVGEMQYAFIAFLLGQSFEGWEQWRRIVALLCSCEAAVYEPQFTPLFVAFLDTLQSHVRELPAEMFVEVDERENFVAAHLNRLAAVVVGDSESPKEIQASFEQLTGLVQSSLGWLITGEDESEDGPVVVDLEEALF